MLVNVEDQHCSDLLELLCGARTAMTENDLRQFMPAASLARAIKQLDMLGLIEPAIPARGEHEFMSR